MNISVYSDCDTCAHNLRQPILVFPTNIRIQKTKINQHILVYHYFKYMEGKKYVYIISSIIKPLLLFYLKHPSWWCCNEALVYDAMTNLMYFSSCIEFHAFRGNGSWYFTIKIIILWITFSLYMMICFFHKNIDHYWSYISSHTQIDQK